MPTPCYIFDIDGTLADAAHRRHHLDASPKAWDAFFAGQDEDAVHEHIAVLAQALSERATIVYVSGRPGEYREVTLRWLQANDLTFQPHTPLYMRTPGDRRDDDVIKIELLAQLRADGYEPIMAFDDRTRVVNAWRAAGIPCAQVAPGDF